MLRDLIKFFDRLEDKTRTKLSHWPILYAFIGGTGVVLFWRGVWHTTDFLTERFILGIPPNQSINLPFPFWWDGFFSLVIGTFLMLLTGLFVSNFIGNEIIISGIRGEKKVAEKTESELENEVATLHKIQQTLNALVKKVDQIEEKLKNKE
jgi:hypothetical protein